MKVNFHEPLDNYARLGDALFTPSATYTPAEFVNSYPPAPSGYCDKDHPSADAYLGARPVKYEVLYVVASFAGAFGPFPERIGYAAALLNLIIDGSQPPNVPASASRLPWTYKTNDPDTNWAGWTPNPQASTSDFHWQLVYQPTKKYFYYVADKWGASGYEGQVFPQKSQNISWANLLTDDPARCKCKYVYGGG